MSVLVDQHSRILVHGVQSRLGRFQCSEMLRYGSTLAAVVHKGDPSALNDLPKGIQVFRSSLDAIRHTSASVSMIFEDPFEVRTTALEAITSGIKTVICLSESVPAWDVIDIRQAAHETGAHFIGPASSGLLVPKCVKAGFYVDEICLPGPVGVITKSGSLSYAVLAEMKSQGIGVSTVIATGGERIKGMNFVDLLPHFLADPKTEALVLLGEIGGSEEEQAAEFLSQHQQKPVVAFISGRSVPMGQSLGHAGAMAQKGRGDYASKANAFRRAGASVADNIGQIPQLLKQMLNSAA